MSESKGRSYPAVQKKCCNHYSQKPLSLMLWSCFFSWCTDFRKEGNSVFQDVITRSKAKNTTNNRSGWSWICWQQNLFFLFIQSKPLPNKSIMTKVRISYMLYFPFHTETTILIEEFIFITIFPLQKKIIPLAKIVQKLALYAGSTKLKYQMWLEVKFNKQLNPK